MKAVNLILALGLGVLVSACGDATLATRNAPFDPGQDAVVQAAPATAANHFIDESAANRDALQVPGKILYNVQRIDVHVPETLRVSEANTYLPNSDIVWREDPMGNRHQQVKTIFEDALRTGAETMNGEIPVSIYVEVRRFHALTERARYTTGGVHAIKFGLAVRDLRTGAFVFEPRMVEADLKAYGGMQALVAEARGQTQKVRISAFLAEVLRQELTLEGGHKNARLGLIQALNHI